MSDDLSLQAGILIGISGWSYDFEVFPVGTIFNAVSGVYIACRQIPTGNFEALYVGKTQSFRDRLNAGAQNHSGLLCVARNGMTDIAALCVSGNAERIRIETDLRHALRPSQKLCSSFQFLIGADVLRGKQTNE